MDERHSVLPRRRSAPARARDLHRSPWALRRDPSAVLGGGTTSRGGTGRGDPVRRRLGLGDSGSATARRRTAPGRRSRPRSGPDQGPREDRGPRAPTRTCSPASWTLRSWDARARRDGQRRAAALNTAAPGTSARGDDGDPQPVSGGDYVRRHRPGDDGGRERGGPPAVNAILDFTGSDEPPCRLWPLEELAVFAPGRALDRARFALGLPHIGRGVG